jgi:hypothetical protein
MLLLNRNLKEDKSSTWKTAPKAAMTYRNVLHYDVCLFHQNLFDPLDRATFEQGVASLTRRLESARRLGLLK